MRKFHVSRRSAIFLALASTSLLLAPSVNAQPPAGDEIIGKWEADDGSVRLDMYKAGSEFQARLLYGNQLVEADNVTFKNDALNPNPALRSRSMKNVVFITDLRWGEGEWSGGSLYDGSSGRTYNCKAEIKDGKMHLRGYLGISLMGQTRVFHRVRG
jgi:uncharacterized protein (DUF2147 family)